MKGHYAYAAPAGRAWGRLGLRSRWRSRCECGWRGPGRRARWEAIFDAKGHRQEKGLS